MRKKSPLLSVLAYGPAAKLRSAWILGCADYMKDPWSMPELHFRLTRLADRTDIEVKGSKLRINLGTLSTDAGDVAISVEEYKILQLLLRHPGEVVPREAFFYAIWDRPEENSRAVDVHISHLRKKLRICFPDTHIIRTARGIGYYFDDFCL